jgi:hypothetical protein
LHPYRDLLKGENTVQTKEYKVQEVKSRNKERKEKK